jgi:hypothetical protein
MGRPGSFATLVRRALQKEGSVTIDDLVLNLCRTMPRAQVTGAKLRPKVHTALRDLCRSGEIECTGDAT